MRASYDKLADVYAYPLGGVWGAPVLTDVPCRIVYQTTITPYGGPLFGQTAWITAADFLGASTSSLDIASGVMTAGMEFAPVFYLDSESTPVWLAVQTQYMTGPDQAPYWRYLVTPFPLTP